MATHYHNKLTIFNDKHISQLRQLLNRMIRGDSFLDFDNLYPIPKEIAFTPEDKRKCTIMWRFKNWGFKSLACWEGTWNGEDFESIEHLKIHPQINTLVFETKGSDADKLFVHVSKEYPEFSFKLESIREDAKNGYRHIIKNGEIQTSQLNINERVIIYIETKFGQDWKDDEEEELQN